MVCLLRTHCALYQENNLSETVTFLLKLGAERLKEYEGAETLLIDNEMLVGL